MASRVRGGESLQDNLAVKLVNVSTYYSGERRPAIVDINLELQLGDFALIVGPNGSGKTTLLETILGLLKPRKGKVYLFGRELGRGGENLRRLCSYLPQDFMKPVGEPFTVKEVVAMGLSPLKPLGRLHEREWREVYRVLELLGVEELAERPFGRLSGGQQQKVMLARALVRRPRLLLLDEPFSAMDTESRRQLASTLLPGLSRSGVTIVMVSHDLSFKPEGYTRLIEMEAGRIRCSSSS